MADLLELSSDVIDNGRTDVLTNRVTGELSEIADRMAIVESFSHVVAVDTGDGVVAFDTSGPNTAPGIVDTLGTWSSSPVTHLVYTHGHIDHVGGSRAFAAKWPEPTVVGHRNVGVRFDRYEQTNGWNIFINQRQFGGVRSSSGLNMSEAEEVLQAWRHFIPSGTLRPGLVVDDHDTVMVGDTTIELYHDKGETDDHLWAWLPQQRTIMAGDFVIWNFPNTGNPQKVQRYPIEWAAALRKMAAMAPELLVPAHGLPIAGTERITTMLTTIADTLDNLVSEVVAMMNDGAPLDEIVHSVSVPDETLALPYMRPLYDEPEFAVRAVWRRFGGWWDGAASRLKPSPDADLARAIADLAGGTTALLTRAQQAANADDFRLACHLADFAGWAAPNDVDVHAARSAIYRARRKAEPSLMAKGIFASAARESELIAGIDSPDLPRSAP